jgi:hypothetical protein
MEQRVLLQQPLEICARSWPKTLRDAGAGEADGSASAVSFQTRKIVSHVGDVDESRFVKS